MMEIHLYFKYLPKYFWKWKPDIDIILKYAIWNRKVPTLAS